jgi:hypothetical protein
MHTNLPTRPLGSVVIAWVLACPEASGAIAGAGPLRPAPMQHVVAI